MGLQNPHQAQACVPGHAGSGEAAMAKRRQLIEGTRHAVRFDHILIAGLDLDGFRLGSGTILTSSFPPGYIAAYLDADHARRDPLVMLTLARGNRTVCDDEAWAGFRDGGDSRKLRALMEHYGVRNRTVVPLSRIGRVYGGVVVTSPHPLAESALEYLEFVAEPLHRVFSAPYAAEIASRMGLTQGELRCIEFASRGLTSQDIAETSGYAFETVNSYLKSATRKLGAGNRPHAVAEALRRGLIA